MVIFGAKFQIYIKMRLLGVIFKPYEKFVSEDFMGFHKKKKIMENWAWKKKCILALGKKE